MWVAENTRFPCPLNETNLISNPQKSIDSSSSNRAGRNQERKNMNRENQRTEKSAGGGVLGTSAFDPTMEDKYWRERHTGQWYAKNRPYDEFQGAYRTGYEGCNKFSGEGRGFDECETELRQEYERNKGKSNLSWEEARHAARAAWQRSSGDYERVLDYDVYDQDDEKIGTIQNLWLDASGKPAFMGVKTGWIFGKNHVVPVGNTMVNDRQRIARLPYPEEKIKDAPTFDPEADLTDADERRIYEYYGVQQPQMRAPQQQTRRETTAPPMQATAKGKEGATIELSEEQMRVGKREVEAGGVRLRKVVRTEIVNQPVELKHEEIVVERVPASGKTPSQSSFQGEDVFIPLRREEAVIEKEARVREQVRVSKTAGTEKQTIQGQVRKEDVEIEQETTEKPRFGTEPGAERQPGKYEPKERGKR